MLLQYLLPCDILNHGSAVLAGCRVGLNVWLWGILTDARLCLVVVDDSSLQTGWVAAISVAFSGAIQVASVAVISTA